MILFLPTFDREEQELRNIPKIFGVFIPREGSARTDMSPSSCGFREKSRAAQTLSITAAFWIEKDMPKILNQRSRARYI